MIFGNNKLSKLFRTSLLFFMTLICLLNMTSCQSMKINSLIKQLNSDKLTDRAKASEGLVKIGELAVEPLIKVLKEDNIKLKTEACKVLGKIQDKRSVEPLISILNDSSTKGELLKAAIIALGNIKDERAVPPLIKHLKNTEAGSASSNALVEIGAPSAKPLIALLNTKDLILISSIESTFVKLGPIAGEPLTSIINDEASSKTDRLNSLKMLSKINFPDKDLVFISASKSKDKEIRLAAISSLSTIGSTRAKDALSEALKDPDKDIRLQAVNALGRTKDPKVTRQLVEMLKDSEETVWKQVVYILATADASTAKALVDYLDGKDLGIVARNYVFFIKQGIPGSEPVLVKALDKYGNTDMAIHYLNCGNTVLYKAAENWAARNGYRVVNVSGGSGGPRWGQK